MRCQAYGARKGRKNPRPASGPRAGFSVSLRGVSNTVSVPNNRQWALLLWIGLVLIWALTQPKIRRGLGAVVRSLISPKFMWTIVGYVGVVALAIWGAEGVGLWSSILVSDTVTWLFISGWALFASFAKVDSEPDFFFRHLRQIIGWSLVAEFVLDVGVLPLVAELALVPVLALLGGLQALTSRNSKYASVDSVVNGCLIVTVLFLVGFGVFTLIASWGSLDWASLGRQAALPVWLTLAVLPYVYLLGVYSTYATFFQLMDWQSSQGWWRRMVARLALITTFGVRGHDLGQLGPQASFGLARSTSWRKAREAIRDQLHQDEELKLEEQRKADRLVRNAGVDGVDEEGRRLDQREFEETRAAMRWLQTCHGGWWRKENRYKEGLLELIGAPHQRHGLDPAKGYQEWVSPDGKSWYAWRGTITGWVFAIGANAPPPNQWTYDGPDPPTGPPDVDSVWGDEPFGDAASPNW